MTFRLSLSALQNGQCMKWQQATFCRQKTQKERARAGDQLDCRSSSIQSPAGGFAASSRMAALYVLDVEFTSLPIPGGIVFHAGLSNAFSSTHIAPPPL